MRDKYELKKYSARASPPTGAPRNVLRASDPSPTTITNTKKTGGKKKRLVPENGVNSPSPVSGYGGHVTGIGSDSNGQVRITGGSYQSPMYNAQPNLLQL